jgi:hypothetical protein
VSKVILLGLVSAASAQSSQFTPYWVRGDSPSPLGVPQLRGTCALDLNGTEILVANRLSDTVTIHELANPTKLDGIITVLTVAPEYYYGPAMIEFYNGPRGVAQGSDPLPGSKKFLRLTSASSTSADNSCGAFP